MHAIKQRNSKVLGGFLAILLAFAGVVLTDTQEAQAASISRPAAEVGVSTTAWTSVCTDSCDLAGFTSTVKVVVWVAQGFVRFPNSSYTSNFGSQLTGYPSANWTNGLASEIAFTASESNANAALEALQYKADGSGTYELRITVTEFVSGTAVDASTGNYYEVVNVGPSTIRWEDARCKAKWGPSSVFTGGTSWTAVDRSTVANDGCSNATSRRQLFGKNGYLANVTTLAEHEFLMDKITGTGWIGGSDHTTDGVWRWNDGPEAGQVFFVQKVVTGYPTVSSLRTTNTIDGRSMFNYFSDGEPNGLNGGESFAEFGFGTNGVGKSWNDCQNACNRTAYIIEYGGDGGAETSSNAAFTSFNVLIPVAPQVSATTAPSSNGVSSNVLRGDVLTSAVTFTGSPAPTFTYVWQTTPSLSGTPVWTNVAGQTQSTLTVSSSQVGRYIRSVVTATNVGGSVQGTSSPTGIVGLAALSSPDLNAASDTGTSSTDDTTQDNTPTIDLAGMTEGASATVTASKAGSTSLSCTTPPATSSGNSSCTLPTLGLGTWSITAIQSLNGMTSPDSSALTIIIEAAPAGSSSGNQNAVPTPTPTSSPRPTSTPTSSPRPSATPAPSPTPSAPTPPAPRLNPAPISRSDGPIASVGGRTVEIEPTSKSDRDLNISLGPVGLSFFVAQGSGNVDSSGGAPELEIKRGKAVDLQGEGMLPGSTVQVWLPGATRNTELGRINVSADGSFSGDVSFGSGPNGQPLPIGPQVIQLTGFDTTGRQTVVNLNVNVAQPDPAPELFRGVASTPAPGFGNFEASNAGMVEQATLTAISDMKQALVEGEGWSLSLQLDGDASNLSESPEGLFMTLVQGETASFGGSGFMPGTIASVWLFSDPTKLGEVVISADGSFSGTTGALDETIATGDHTIQIQGVGQDGFIRSANLGVAVAAAPLITAPASTWGWALSGLVAIAVAGGIFLWIFLAGRSKTAARSNVIPFRKAA
jgi:hypothetical protein